MKSYSMNCLKLFAATCLVFAGQISLADQGGGPLDVQFDSKVFSEVHHMNQVQLQMADIALQKATRTEVRDLANHIKTDFTDFDKQVMVLANHGGIQIRDISQDPSEAADVKLDQQNMDKLNSAQGADFDKAFLDTLISESQFHVNELSAEVGNLQDTDHRDFVNSVITELNKHIAMAQALEK